MLKMSCFFSNRLKSSLKLWMIHLAFLSAEFNQLNLAGFANARLPHSPFKQSHRPPAEPPNRCKRVSPLRWCTSSTSRHGCSLKSFKCKIPIKIPFKGQRFLKFHKGWRIPMKIDMKIESIYIFISNHLPTNSQTWTSMPPGLPEGKVSHM